MEQIRDVLAGVVGKVFPKAGVGVEVVTAPANQKADYSSNVAFLVAARVKKSPREVAEALVAGWNEKEVSVEVAGAGFLNFVVGDEVLRAALGKFEVVGRSKKYKGKVVVTEFSDPNPFKVLHVGHLYTSIVGDAVSRLVEYAGGEVHRVNFGGDVGMHVAKTMWAMRERMGKFVVGRLPRGGIAIRMNWIADRYVEGTVAYEESETAREEIVALNKDIYKVSTSGDRKSGLAKVYWKCRGWSYEYFEKFYGHIGVKFEKYYPESTVAELGLKTVKKNVPKVYQESDGAIVFKGEKYGLHTRVFVNAQGLPTYEAKDVGLLEQKWKDYKYDESIIVTSAEQTEYMKVMLKSVEQFAPKLAKSTRHIEHGNVILPGAVKMSSRKGNFLRAIEVLDMVSAEEKRALGEEEQRQAMRALRAMMMRFVRAAMMWGKNTGKGDTLGAVVKGAVKYAFLRAKIGPENIVFDLKESVNLHGNSGPYLQYALVRAKSILRQAHSSANSLSKSAVRTQRIKNTSHSRSSSSTADFTRTEHSQESMREMDEWERGLLKKILEWEGVVISAVEELQPYKVCGYLYELAQEFSRFYEHDRVIGGENEGLRLELVRRYVEVLEGGFEILGMPAIGRM